MFQSRKHPFIKIIHAWLPNAHKTLQQSTTKTGNNKLRLAKTESHSIENRELGSKENSIERRNLG